VTQEGADLGIAYDGDADRLAMVDETGQAVFADQLLALLARQALAHSPGRAVVYELSCTGAVADVVEAAGGHAVPCPVGYAYVHEAMRLTHAILGGEAAGHLFFADPDFRFDDAFLATARVVSLLSQAQTSLAALVAQLPQYVLSPSRRFHCPDDQKDQVVATVRDDFAGQGLRVEEMDGAKIHFEDGWALFRPSTTQPAVTLRCEGRTHHAMSRIEETMLQAVRQALTQIGIPMRDAH
jgi:phosphomannomutase